MAYSISVEALWACTAERWSPGIGDPSLMGWITVIFYITSAALCLVVALRRHPGEAVFWTGMALMMGALALNKQLDLQVALTAVGRCVAQIQGWYAERRSVQAKFILALLSCGGAISLILFWRMRTRLVGVWCALLGFCMLTIFIAIRATSFHHVDMMITTRINTVRVNEILEIGGSGLILLNALVHLLRPQRGKAPF